MDTHGGTARAAAGGTAGGGSRPAPEAAPPRRRGRPRDAGLDARVLAAAVDELAERGLDGFSVNGVVARSGAARRGIAARWPERDDLVLAALGTLAAGLVPPRTGTLRGDLEALAPRVAAVLAERRMAVLQRCLQQMPDHPHLFAAFRRDSVDSCAAAVEDVFHDARARGETRPDLDPALATELFLGTVTAPAAFWPGPGGRDPARLAAIVEMVLAAARPVSPPGRCAPADPPPSTAGRG